MDRRIKSIIQCPNCGENSAYQIIIKLPESSYGDMIYPYYCDRCQISFNNKQEWDNYSKYWLSIREKLWFTPKWMETRKILPKGVKIHK